jgi:hypothetical protein
MVAGCRNVSLWNAQYTPSFCGRWRGVAACVQCAATWHGVARCGQCAARWFWTVARRRDCVWRPCGRWVGPCVADQLLRTVAKFAQPRHQ